MVAQLIFQAVYPFFILISIFWFLTVSLDALLTLFSIICFMSILKSVLACLRAGSLKYMFFGFYCFLFMLFLLPSKLWGLMTVWHTEWGTSSRKKRSSNIQKALHALIWAVLFIGYWALFLTLHLTDG